MVKSKFFEKCFDKNSSKIFIEEAEALLKEAIQEKMERFILQKQV